MYLVENEGFPEEENWIWEPSYKIQMCLIGRFVNSWFCSDHEVVLERDLNANVSNGARQSGYKGRKCPKCERKVFVFNQDSIPVHQLHLLSRSDMTRRKKQKFQ